MDLFSLIITKRVFMWVTTQYIILVLNPTEMRAYGYILNSTLVLRSILRDIPWTRILSPDNSIFWSNQIYVHISSIKFSNMIVHLITQVNS
jgi:hypothetical protein